MKHVRGSMFAFCLLLFAAAAGAQNLNVVFLEGKAEAGRNSKWADLAVGGSVHPGATIRLPAGALLRLSGMGVDITLARPGLYPLRDVAAARTSAFVGGGGGIAADACRLAAFGASTQGPVLGAASAEPEKKGDVDIVEAGKEDIRTKQYAAAQDKLKKALSSAKGNQGEIRFCLATAYVLDGKLPEAWKQADGLAPGAGDPWAADFTLLRARLLLETSSYAEAISLLGDASKSMAGDAVRAPITFYLSALGYRGAGQSKEAALAFKQAAALSPATDLGRSAGMLANIP